MAELDGTTIEYNGITIRNVTTEAIDVEPLKDSFGHVDIVGIKVRMQFTGVIHCNTGGNCRGYQLPGTTQGDCASGTGTNLGPSLATMIEMFLQPRGVLRVSLGGQTLWHITPSVPGPNPQLTTCGPVSAVGTDLEINNGPTTALRIISVQYNYSVRAAFTIDFVKAVRCRGQQGQVLQDVQHLRYVVDEDIDCTTWIRTRTYRGKLRTYGVTGNTSGMFAIIDPYALARWLALPPLQDGFRRETIRFALSENGLELSFTIIDKEQKASAPYPACDWDGSFAIVFPDGEITCDSTLEFTLKAAPEIAKIELILLAYRIFEAKTAYTQRNRVPGDPDKYTGLVYVTHHELSESLRDNSIHASWRLRNHNPHKWLSNLRATGAADSTNMIGADLPSGVTYSPWKPYNPLLAMDPPSRLTDLAGLFICALQNPCCIQSMPSAWPESIGSTYSHADASYPTQVTYEPTSDNVYSEAHDTKMFQWYKLSSRLSADTGWRGFPLGRQCPQSGQTGTATAAFSQIHCHVAVRHVRLHGARVDEWPQLPRPETWKDRYGITHALAYYSIEPCPPAFSADGTSVLNEVYADYFYYLDRPPDVSNYGNEGIIAGVLPYATKKQVPEAMSVIGRDKFIDPAQILDRGKDA